MSYKEKVHKARAPVYRRPSGCSRPLAGSVTQADVIHISVLKKIADLFADSESSSRTLNLDACL